MNFYQTSRPYIPKNQFFEGFHNIFQLDLFNEAVSNQAIECLMLGWLGNDVLEKMWNKAVVAKFEALF
jgi:hypothetical protein